MPYYAKTQCPACGNRFQTPLDQILDVRVDPEVKQRMLSGAVNVAQCPSCGWVGRLNVPFIYHDPAKEVALLYLPTEAGRNEAERQKAAGRLTRRLSNALPPEERKGYLLNPETFITMDSLVRRVLDLEGVTEEDMERSETQQNLLRDLLEAEEEAWEEMVEENAELIDESFFYILNHNMQMIESIREQQGEEQLPPQTREMLDKVELLQDYLAENHPLGQRLAARTDVVRPFLENPNRDTLVDALVSATDDETVEMLVQSGAQLMDYGFFQKLVKRIDEADDEEERARLKALRRKVLDLRDKMMQSSQAVFEERAKLLQDLIRTEEPLKMARSHSSELDEAFSYVLQNQIQQAQQAGNEQYLSRLQELTEVLDQLMEQSMPPQVALVRRLLMAPSDEAAIELLEENRELVNESFLQFLEAVEEQSRESGDDEVADTLKDLHDKAQRFIAPIVSPDVAGPKDLKQPSDEEPLGPGEKRGPGGLIISSKK